MFPVPFVLYADFESYLTFSGEHVSQPCLIPNLNNKTKYVTHIKNLKLYKQLGLVITKIHRVLEFKQEAWLKSYIEFNTNKRKAATSDFEKTSLNSYQTVYTGSLWKAFENV